MEIIGQLLPFIFLLIVMYFVIIRPHQKESRDKEKMISALKKGDKVITSGGVLATIYKIEDKFFSIKINDDIIIKITKGAVVRKYEDEA